jgi:hypothetical protein
MLHLPACLKELELSEFCGALHELPPSLTSLFACDWRGATGVVALVKALEAAPTGLQALTLHRKSRGRRPRADELEGVQCPAGVTELSLKSVGWRMKLPLQLQMLTLRYCVLKTELRLPDTLRRVKFAHCSIRDHLVLNEGLLCLELQGNTQCRMLLQLPSTLEVLVMDDSSDAPLAQPLPAHLETLMLGDSFDAALGPLPESLEELSLGASFSEPLGALPASLRILDMTEADFDHPLGELPWQLHELRLSPGFDQPLGDLPQSLEVLEMGEEFSCQLALPLPSSLRTLHIDSCFEGSLGVLPQSLTELVVGASFDDDLRLLPQSLEVLDMSQAFNYDHPLPPLAELPAGLHTLKLMKTWGNKHWPKTLEIKWYDDAGSCSNSD